MAYMSAADLASLGFRKLGQNVKISDRATIINPGNMEIGNNCRIDDFCIISAGDQGIEIGNQVHIAPYVSLIGAAKITIGDFSGISSKSAIYSSTDDFSGSSLIGPCVPDQFRNVTNAAVSVGRHVIIGVGVMIMPGVRIGEGAAVGSMSLVNKSCEDFGLYVGIPAKRIKERSRAMLEVEKKYEEWAALQAKE